MNSLLFIGLWAFIVMFAWILVKLRSKKVEDEDQQEKADLVVQIMALKYENIQLNEINRRLDALDMGNRMRMRHIQMIYEEALYAAENKKQGAQFTDEEIRQLIRLVHPDKHGNSETATKLTQRLLSMRK